MTHMLDFTDAAYSQGVVPLHVMYQVSYEVSCKITPHNY
jgi:hypothetical protein